MLMEQRGVVQLLFDLYLLIHDGIFVKKSLLLVVAVAFDRLLLDATMRHDCFFVLQDMLQTFK